MAERSKARVYGQSLAGIPGSNPAGVMDVCVVCVVRQGQKGKGQESQHKEVTTKCRERITKKKMAVGEKFSAPDQTCSWAHSAFCKTGSGG